MNNFSKCIEVINKAMRYIEEAAAIAADDENTQEYLMECGCYEETYNPAFWIIDYITKEYED